MSRGGINSLPFKAQLAELQCLWILPSCPCHHGIVCCAAFRKSLCAWCPRGVLEPAQAALCAMAFGMPHASTFDISEGCASYVRAMEVGAPGVGMKRNKGLGPELQGFAHSLEMLVHAHNAAAQCLTSHAIVWRASSQFWKCLTKA